MGETIILGWELRTGAVIGSGTVVLGGSDARAVVAGNSQFDQNGGQPRQDGRRPDPGQRLQPPDPAGRFDGSHRHCVRPAHLCPAVTLTRKEHA